MQLQQLIPEYEKTIAFIPVSLDSSADQTQRFMGQNGFEFDVYVNPTGSSLGALGIRYIPTLVLLDDSGRPTLMVVGAKTDDEMRKLLDDLLE